MDAGELFGVCWCCSFSDVKQSFCCSVRLRACAARRRAGEQGRAGAVTWPPCHGAGVDSPVPKDGEGPARAGPTRTPHAAVGARGGAPARARDRPRWLAFYSASTATDAARL